MTDIPDINLFSTDAPQRMGPLARLPALMVELGARIEPALDGTGIARAAFDDPEHRISYREGSHVLARCAELAACPHLGLLLGARGDHRDLGVPGLWMANAATLGAALSGYVTMQAANSRGATVYLHRSGEHFVFGYGIYEPLAIAQAQIYPLAVAMMVNVGQVLTGNAAPPVEVLLPIREPDNASLYRTLLCGTVRFNQLEAGVVLRRAALEAPILQSVPGVQERLRAQIASQLSPADWTWTEQVRRAIRPLILSGSPTTADMAEIFGVTARTLARRLAQEGTTFQALLDRVRDSMARELLVVTDLSAGEIADALCYAQQSSFTAAFRRWSGVTPSEWRHIMQKRRQAAAPGLA